MSAEPTPRHFGLASLLSPYRGRLAVAFLCLVLVDVLQLAIPREIRVIFDGLRASFPLPALRQSLFVLLAVAGGMYLLRLAWLRLLIGTAYRVERDLRNRIYARLQLKPPAFFAGHSTGELLSRFTFDVDAVQRFCGQGLRGLTDFAVLTVLALSFLFYLDPALTVSVLSPLLLVPIVFVLFQRRIYRQSMRVQERYGALSAQVQETIAGAGVLAAFLAAPAARRRFDAANLGLRREAVRLGRQRALFEPLLVWIVYLSFLPTIVLGGEAVMLGRLSLGTLVAFFTCQGMMVWPMMALGDGLSLLAGARAAQSRLAQLQQPGWRPADWARDESGQAEPEPPEGPAEGQPAASPAQAGEAAAISIRDLSLELGGRKILDRLALDVPAGTFLGLTGPSGAGKSALCTALSGLLPVFPGSILVAGHDLAALPFDTLRHLVGVAPQEPFVFSDSVLENIRFGAPASSACEVASAARDAGLAAEIERLEHGYATRLEERGANLSGGQRQRLCLARTLLLDRAIYLLDDVTGSVDQDTERQILASLRRRLAGRTVILVSHRAAVLRACDCIAYLERGRIVEQGTHQALLQARGPYHALASRQDTLCSTPLAGGGQEGE